MNQPSFELKELQEDTGPWSISFWDPRVVGGPKRIVLQSDFFYYDAALEVTGDFFCFEEKLAYAKRLCERLNASVGAKL
jgi:hypothetical protein